MPVCEENYISVLKNLKAQNLHTRISNDERYSGLWLKGRHLRCGTTHSGFQRSPMTLANMRQEAVGDDRGTAKGHRSRAVDGGGTDGEPLVILATQFTIPGDASGGHANRPCWL